MRKFWIVLLSFALIMAFTFPAAAADVKFDGSFVVQGTYDNNRLLKDVDGQNAGSVSSIYQRARIGTTFQVAEGLKFTTRFDAMEKVWGAAAGASGDATSENIKFELAYVTFATALGTFDVGYQIQSRFGTAFGDSGETDTGGRLKYTLVTGPMTWLAILDKIEGGKGNATPGSVVEHDKEKYSVAGMYNFTGGSTGLLIQYILYTATADTQVASATTGYKTKVFVFVPYVKAKFGPVYVEGELGYAMGKAKEYFNPTVAFPDQDASQWRGYIFANVDLAPAYVGATVFYASGDDPTTLDKAEGGLLTTGTEFSPCLILLNYDLGKWYGAVGNYVGVTNNVSNIFAGQLFAGIKPIPKLDVKFSITYAQVNEDKVNAAGDKLISKNLGYEADLTASYKIYDNLEYMIGFGYLFAGDAFKGTVSTNKVSNDYLVTHKLTLTF